MPEDYVEMMQRCWDVDQSKRPNFLILLMIIKIIFIKMNLQTMNERNHDILAMSDSNNNNNNLQQIQKITFIGISFKQNIR